MRRTRSATTRSEFRFNCENAVLRAQDAGNKPQELRIGGLRNGVLGIGALHNANPAARVNSLRANPEFRASLKGVVVGVVILGSICGGVVVVVVW